MSDAPRRASQADLTAATKRYSTAAGARQSPLATPLSPAELYAGGGDEVGITDVDCTPRPRYGESRERFEARIRGYERDAGVVHRVAAQRNRAAALRQVELHTGAIAYWTVCACGFCGLRVDDPEVARREYDAHACAAAGVGEAAQNRAIAAAKVHHMPGVPTFAPRESVLQPSLAAPDVGELERMTADVPADETEERMALLEGIPK